MSGESSYKLRKSLSTGPWAIRFLVFPHRFPRDAGSYDGPVVAVACRSCTSLLRWCGDVGNPR